MRAASLVKNARNRRDDSAGTRCAVSISAPLFGKAARCIWQKIVPPVAYARLVSGSSCVACAGVRVILSMRFTPRFPFRTYRGETGNEGKRDWKRRRVFRFPLGKNGNGLETGFSKSGNETVLFVSLRFHPRGVIHRSLRVYFLPVIVSHPARSAFLAIFETVPLLTPISSESSPHVFSPSLIHWRISSSESASR